MLDIVKVYRDEQYENDIKGIIVRGKDGRYYGYSCKWVSDGPELRIIDMTVDPEGFIQRILNSDT